MAENKNIDNRFSRFLAKTRKWMVPGLGIKRWILVNFFGVAFVAVGAAFFLLDIYRTTPDTWWLPALSVITLRFLPRIVRVIIFAGIGFGVLGWGMWGLNRSLLEPFMQKGQPTVETIVSYRKRERGAKVVAIGGGTGLATMLRGLKHYTSNLTAIVTVADDGGSSGRLRKTLGILPPGDIRNCLAALSNDESLITQLFQYRFANGGEGSLQGHSFGNLFLSAMNEITGSFEDSIAASSRVLSVSGQVVPSTLADVDLNADVILPEGRTDIRVKGESRIPEIAGKGRIRRVWLEPSAPPVYPKAVQAILGADLIVVGPGSLYTSILPNLLVPDITAAIKASQALKIFVCNVATQPGETHGFSVERHIQVVEEHISEDLFDLILVNIPNDEFVRGNMEWVQLSANVELVHPVHLARVFDEEFPWRHDAGKLAKVLVDLLLERTGPLTM